MLRINLGTTPQYTLLPSGQKATATASEGEASGDFTSSVRASLSKSAYFFPFQHSGVHLAFSLLLPIRPIEPNRSYSTHSQHQSCSCCGHRSFLRYQMWVISLPMCWHVYLPYAKCRGRSRGVNKTQQCSVVMQELG